MDEEKELAVSETAIGDSNSEIRTNELEKAVDRNESLDADSFSGEEGSTGILTDNEVIDNDPAVMEINEEPKLVENQEVEIDIPEEEVSEEIKQPTAEAVVPDQEIEVNNTMLNKKTVIYVIVAVLIVLVVVFIASRKPVSDDLRNFGSTVSVKDQLEQGKITIIEETRDDISVLIAGTEEIKWPKTKVFAFFGNTRNNPNSQDCSLSYPLEREIDKRYDSNMLNSVLALLEPLSNLEKEKGYVSSIPTGTKLEYIKLDDSGVATVNFSGNIGRAAGSCAVTAIKTQIRDTVSQFASVKSIVICINDNCKEDEILQP